MTQADKLQLIYDTMSKYHHKYTLVYTAEQVLKALAEHEAENVPCPRTDDRSPSCTGVPFGSYINTIVLPRPAHMYPTSKGAWITIDACMIPEILTLWQDDIWTLECCCGHCKTEGYIAVAEESREAMESLGYIASKEAPHVYVSKTQCSKPVSIPYKLPEDRQKALKAFDCAKKILDKYRDGDHAKYIKAVDTFFFYHHEAVSEALQARSQKNHYMNYRRGFFAAIDTVLNLLQSIDCNNHSDSNECRKEIFEEVQSLKPDDEQVDI